MPYTNGAGSGDDLTISRTTSGLSTLLTLFMTWIKPDSLGGGANGDFIFSLGNVTGIAQGTTSAAEIRITNDHATTDGVWETTDVGLVAGEWKFLAVMMHAATASFRATVWSGTADNPPKLNLATSVTAASGAVTSSASHTLGNRGTGSVAFAGQIGQTAVIQMVAGSAAGDIGKTYTAGSINLAGDAELLSRVINPAWRDMATIRQNCMQSFGVNHDMTFFPMNGPVVDRVNYTATNSTNAALLTVNGSTVSQEREPRPIPCYPLMSGPQLVRRR
jgi:hypothetical protein